MIKLLKNFRSPNSADNADVRCSEDEPYIVYKLSEDGERYELYEPYDEANVSADSYADGDYVAIPLTSTGCSTVDFYQNEMIKNVHGSSGDPRIDNLSWIQLLRSRGCDATHCCTDGQFYDLPNGVNPPAPCDPLHTNPRDLRGGHVVRGQYADPVVPRDGEVYLLSICNHHNVTNVGQGIGLGYSMRVRKNCKGLRLYGYIPRFRVEDAIQAEAIAEAAATTD